MKRVMSAAALLLLMAAAARLTARQPEPPGAVLVATGKVLRVDDKTLSVQPRKDGKFGEAVTLQLTDTSRVTRIRLTPAKSTDPKAERYVVAQLNASPKDLEKDQLVGVVYANAGTEGGKPVYVLLSAVIQPAREK